MSVWFAEKWEGETMSDIEKMEKQIAQLQARIKAEKLKQKQNERKDRNHALMLYGAMLERACGGDWKRIDPEKADAYFRRFAMAIKREVTDPEGVQTPTAADANARIRAFEKARRAGTPKAGDGEPFGKGAVFGGDAIKTVFSEAAAVFTRAEERPADMRAKGAVAVSNINGGHEDKQNVALEQRIAPICDVPVMVAGGKLSGGQSLIIEAEEKDELLTACPAAQRWIRPFSTGGDFINGAERYCLWLVGITQDELDAMPPVRERVELVRQMRLASKKAKTRKKAETPWLFGERRTPQGESYIVVPRESSVKRDYIPMGFVTNDMILGDNLFCIFDAGLYEFGVLMSCFHNAWMREAAGRHETRYRYSNTIVYNNFIWPDPTDTQREAVEACARAVLDAREAHPGKTLADLYDPDKMPADLLAAHRALDAAVEAAYGVDFDGDEERIVAHLFKLYAAATSG